MIADVGGCPDCAVAEPDVFNFVVVAFDAGIAFIEVAAYGYAVACVCDGEFEVIAAAGDGNVGGGNPFLEVEGVIVDAVVGVDDGVVAVAAAKQVGVVADNSINNDTLYFKEGVSPSLK